ncbi:MAG TPA: hypothetical protein VGS61_05335 [Acidimicrobiales bacterium]|nr:hypothetical protein [Acidimicrobiales bacterium]
MSERWTPRESVRDIVAARGLDWVVERCVETVTGRGVDADLIVATGGGLGELILTGRAGGVGGYWPRVWALRAFLYAWSERAAPAVLAALDDPAWRAREMALKVAVKRGVSVPDARRRRALADPVPRVRNAAARLTAPGSVP